MVAFKLPFELFLFSYAVLGPLHYLTEIAWLKKQNFFTQGKRDWIVLTVICFFYFLCYMTYAFRETEALEGMYLSLFGENYMDVAAAINNFSTHFIFLAFVISLAMVVVKNIAFRVIIGVVAAVAAYLADGANAYAVIFSVFLPTLIHVSIFTGAFMLYGALRGRDRLGLIVFFIFVAAGCLCFFGAGSSSYEVAESTQETFKSTNFQWLNYQFLKASDELTIINGQIVGLYETIFESDFGIAIQRFVAFSYTYHYFNWFSKTSIIKWHKVPKSWLLAVLIIWGISVSLYAYDYKVGLLALLFLSMLHVILEFPLNYKSFIGIGQELGKRFSGSASTK